MTELVGGQVGFFRVEGAGRGPAGLDVSEVKGVEHGPEDIALSAERGVGGVLFFASASVLHDPGQGEVGIFGSLREAASEIVEPRLEPGIIFAKFFHTERNEPFGEKFGK